MYPYPIIGNISLYEICFTVGLIVALVIFRLLCDVKKMTAKATNFYIVCAVVSIAAGYGGAILFQAAYNALESGKFVINNETGMTFLGGLISGTAVFLLLHATVARKLFSRDVRKKNFFVILTIAPCCICAAHGFGRIGCLMAGCCYGISVTSPIGVLAQAPGRHLPVQLFEAVFLFVLSVILTVLFVKGYKVGFPVYLAAYGAFRFVIEYFRADYRGNLIPGLSPSQTLSLLMVVFGVVWIIYLFYKKIPFRENGEGGEIGK